jgi:hypothetical protein
MPEVLSEPDLLFVEFCNAVSKGSFMNTRTSIAALRQHFENLFPGKWVRAGSGQKTLVTGIAEIDHSLARGLARQRITEWIGTVSSGKTSILRAIISNWCAFGFDVAYIDTEDKLVASDWIFIEKGICGAKPASMPDHNQLSSLSGRFWVIRNLSLQSQDGPGVCVRRDSQPLPSGFRDYPAQIEALQIRAANRSNKRFKRRLIAQEHLWAADELIRCNAFDVVILDLGSSERTKPVSSRVYARLQNSLSRSKTALILLRDSESSQPGWGCYAQIGFRWGPTLNFVEGLHGAVTILPSIYCSVIKDGLSHRAEVQVTSHVTNSLFTHPQVPDRRTSKA